MQHETDKAACPSRRQRQLSGRAPSSWTPRLSDRSNDNMMADVSTTVSFTCEGNCGYHGSFEQVYNFARMSASPEANNTNVTHAITDGGAYVRAITLHYDMTMMWQVAQHEETCPMMLAMGGPMIDDTPKLRSERSKAAAAHHRAVSSTCILSFLLACTHEETRRPGFEDDV